MDHDREYDRRRIERLRALAARLEQLPRSPARDRLLREAHHRTVTVDTGLAGGLFQHMALGRFVGGR
jgi:hypothetical protein